MGLLTSLASEEEDELVPPVLLPTPTKKEVKEWSSSSMSITLTPSLSLAALLRWCRLLRRLGVGATPECGLGGFGGSGEAMTSTWDSGRNQAMPAVLATPRPTDATATSWSMETSKGINYFSLQTSNRKRVRQKNEEGRGKSRLGLNEAWSFPWQPNYLD